MGRLMKVATNKLLHQAITVSVLALAVTLKAPLTVAQVKNYDSALVTMRQHWSTLETYCTGCHNFEDYSGGLDLTLMTPEDIVKHPETFEMVLKKLRGAVMPPPNQNYPTLQERWDLVSAIENTLDSYAAEHPDPGRVGLHRLNRNEYVNAVKDLTGVRISAELALPKDDNSDGFDNVAAVLKVSPTFIDQYISSARLVAELTVGSHSPRNEETVYAVDGSYQGAHVDGLPLGTRGGALIEHQFPVDGDYTLTIPAMAGAGYTLGMEYTHEVIVTLDGKLIFRKSIGGGEDLKSLDQIQAPAVAEINARFADIPLQVSSGIHKIGVGFVARSFAESDEFLGSLGPNRGMDRIAQMRRVVIKGPLKSNGHIATDSRRKVMICEPMDITEETACARQILAQLAKGAFRRPITEEDLQDPMTFFEQGRRDGGFDSGIKNGLIAILTSPKFLFRTTLPQGDISPGDIVPISDIEMASRLSFFLWSSIPDKELLDLGAKGELSKPEVLDAQIKRMLADHRAIALVENFFFQWLRLRDLESVDPDPEIFPDYTPSLMDAFKEEIKLFALNLLKDNRPVSELLVSNTTYLNEDLALHYDITDVKGDQFRQVKLAQEERFGLLGKGGIQMVTSYANRTTPVIRGAYLMENFMGVPPADPPRDVPGFPETKEGQMVAETVRERLERHRDNPACAGCHDIMDPLGLALENFNSIGKFRLRDSDAGNVLIDASGKLADGRPLDGVNDLRKALIERKDQFPIVITEKLMTYALGRSVEAQDMPAVRAIVRQAETENYTFVALIRGVINSDQFRLMTMTDEKLQIGSID
jgi:hypothetical protein